MGRWLVAVVLTAAGLAGWIGGSAARVAFIPAPPLAAQVAQAELILVGRVVGHEPADVEVPVAPKAKETIKFRIAVVKVVDPILGIKDQKTVRVGFQPTGENEGRPVRPRPGLNPNLEVGLNAMFFLHRHPGGNFYVAEDPYTVRAAGENTKDGEIKTLKELAKWVEAPMDGLKAKTAEQRWQAAILMIHRYRHWRGPGEPKEELLPQETSKLILSGLAEGDWSAQGRVAFSPSFQAFLQLGVTEKDGFQGKGANAETLKLAQEWCRKNAETYRIKRFVPQPAPGFGPSGGGPRIDLKRD